MTVLIVGIAAALMLGFMLGGLLGLALASGKIADLEDELWKLKRQAER